MELKLRGEFVAYVDSNEEANRLIENHQKLSFIKYQEFKALYEATVSGIEKIRPKGELETNPEYMEYVSENYAGVWAGIRKLGDIMLKEGYEDIYFYNSKDMLIGYKLKDGSVSLSLFPLKAALLFPKKDEFTIE